MAWLNFIRNSFLYFFTFLIKHIHCFKIIKSNKSNILKTQEYKVKTLLYIYIYFTNTIKSFKTNLSIKFDHSHALHSKCKKFPFAKEFDLIPSNETCPFVETYSFDPMQTRDSFLIIEWIPFNPSLPSSQVTFFYKGIAIKRPRSNALLHATH